MEALEPLAASQVVNPTGAWQVVESQGTWQLVETSGAWQALQSSGIWRVLEQLGVPRALEALQVWLSQIDWRIAVAYLLGVTLVYALARALLLPVRLAVNLLVDTALGVAAIAAFNLAGSFFGVGLPLNPVTAVISGILGVPGIAMLVALKYLVFA